MNSRPLELHGWQGFAQQLAHTSPDDINPDTYDDLVTVVLHKDNAILYAGFAQIKKTGERADSGVEGRAGDEEGARAARLSHGRQWSAVRLADSVRAQKSARTAANRSGSWWCGM